MTDPAEALKGDQMEVKKELSDREFLHFVRHGDLWSGYLDQAQWELLQSLAGTKAPSLTRQTLCDLAELRLDLAEARDDTARLTLAREAIEVALDRLSVDGDCFDFEGLTNHLRGALAAIDAAKGKE